MANFEQLKATVANVIKTNGEENITGAIMQDVLLTIINSIAGGYMFGGVAQHSGNVGNPDYNVFYLAGSGAYTGYGGAITIPDGCYGVFLYDGTWSQEVVDIGVHLTGDVATGEQDGVTGGRIKQALDDLEDNINTAINELASAIRQTFESLLVSDVTAVANKLVKITEGIRITAGGQTVNISTFDILAATAEKAGLMSAADKSMLDGLFDKIRTLSISDTTPQGDEGVKVVESLSATLGDTAEVISTFTILAATASKAGLMSAADKTALDTLPSLINAGYLYAGIATPSTVPSSTDAKIFYIAIEGGTYTSFGNLNVTQGINIIYKSGNAWSVAQVVGIDNEPTAGSDNLVKSGGVAGVIYDFYGYFGNTDSVYKNDVVFISVDRSKQKPGVVKAIRFAYRNGPIRFYKVSTTNDSILPPTPITEEMTFTEAGEKYISVNVVLGDGDYIGVSGRFAYQSSGAPKTSGYTSVPFAGKDSGPVFSTGQALGFQIFYNKIDANAKKIGENTTDILNNRNNIEQNTEVIFDDSQIELKHHISVLLDMQNLECIDWNKYVNLVGDTGNVYVNLNRHSGKNITDIYYKTKGGETIFCLISVEDGVYTNIQEIQSNNAEVSKKAYIAHCKLSTPVNLGEGQYIGIKNNFYYANGTINDKAYNSVYVGSPVLFQKNSEIGYLSVDETLQDKSLIKDEACSILSPSDFIKNNGLIRADGSRQGGGELKNTGFVDVSSLYRVVASFQTQGIDESHGQAIILYDEHFEVVKTYYAYNYTRNCLFNIYFDKRVKYMLINVYYNINGADYTTYSCYGYKRLQTNKQQNVLYRKKFNSNVIYPEYTNATAENFTANGLLINSNNPIVLNKYYSLQTRTLRLLLKFNSQTVFKVASSDGSSYVEVNTNTATMTMYATTPQSVFISDFSSDYTYLLEVIRNYDKNIARITNINKGTVYEVEFTENGTGGAGRGSVGTYASAGTWHDYYEFSASTGSAYIKEMNIVPLYGKVKTLLYGDSVTELLYYPSTDYSKSWVQQFISACANRVMVSPRGGTSIGDILLRIPNELPYIDAEYVMITIGTNGGVTFENMCELIEYIIKHGAVPVLNHIPCNINSGGSSNQATINAIVDSVRAKYGIHGVDFDIATSVNLDGENVDTNKMWWEDYTEPTGSVYHHPNVIGSNAMFEQIKMDMPELLI